MSDAFQLEGKIRLFSGRAVNILVTSVANAITPLIACDFLKPTHAKTTTPVISGRLDSGTQTLQEFLFSKDEKSLWVIPLFNGCTNVGVCFQWNSCCGPRKRLEP